MVWLKVVTNQEKLGVTSEVQVCLRAVLAASDHVDCFWTCWSLSCMFCVCPDSWDPALNVGSEKQLSSYSLDLDMPLEIFGL